MPITIGSRLRSWRAGASHFVRLGLEGVHGVPVVEVLAGPAKKFMDEVKEGTEVKHRAEFLLASILDFVETIINEYGADNEDGRLIAIVDSSLLICDDIGILLEKGQLGRWASLAGFKKSFDEAGSRFEREKIKLRTVQLRIVNEQVTGLEKKTGGVCKRLDDAINAGNIWATEIGGLKQENRDLKDVVKNMQESLNGQGRQSEDLRGELAGVRHGQAQIIQLVAEQTRGLAQLGQVVAEQSKVIAEQDRKLRYWKCIAVATFVALIAVLLR